MPDFNKKKTDFHVGNPMKHVEGINNEKSPFNMVGSYSEKSPLEFNWKRVGAGILTGGMSEVVRAGKKGLDKRRAKKAAMAAGGGVPPHSHDESGGVVSGGEGATDPLLAAQATSQGGGGAPVDPAVEEEVV